MKSILRRLPVVIIVFLSIITFANADYLSSAMFEQWGNEIISQIDDSFGRSDGIYGQTVSNNSPEYAWGQGIMLGANVAAAKIDDAYISSATRQADELHASYRCYSNGYWAYNAGRYGNYDRYYDDNAWIALTFLELYEITHQSKYLDWAREIIIFCMSGENGPNDSPQDGGIRWHETRTDSPRGTTSVCATAPTILANLMAYQITGTQKYLDDAQRMYLWMVDSNLRYSHWLYHETNQGPLGYQTAVMTQNAVRLYQYTGNNQYLEQAYFMAMSMEDEYVNGVNHSLNQHGKWGGHDMTNAYVDLYFLDGNSRWLDIAAGYLEYLYYNGHNISNGLYPDVWNKTSNNYSSALIDNASVARSFWTMALTDGAYTSGNNYTNQLITHLTLDQQSGTTAADSSGHNNSGTLSGSSFSFDNSAVNGRFNGALNFDGSNDYISLGQGYANLKGGMTISVWAYPTAVKSWSRFVDMGNGEYNSNIVFGRRGSSNDLFFEAYDRDNSGGQVRAENVIQLNSWQLFTVTLDIDGSVAIYKNGVLVSSGQTAVPTNIERMYNYIGRSNWSADSYYQGRMDDVRIYNYALTNTEVNRLYQYGGQAYNPSPADFAPNVTCGKILSWYSGLSTNIFDVYFGTNYDAVANADHSSDEYKARVSTSSYTPSIESGEVYYWRVDAIINSLTISKGSVWSFTSSDSPANDLMVHFSMDAEFIDGKTVIDSANGAILSGTMIGQVSSVSGKVSGALNFDGYGDYINMPPGFDDFSNGMTVSFWAYPTAVHDWARFIDFGNGASNDNIIFARPGSNNDISFHVYRGSSSGSQITASGALELNKWQMFTATLNPFGYVRIYKNGQQVANGRTNIPRNVVRTNNYIGKSNWSNEYYKGNLDEFAIWDRVLSDNEITAIYNRSSADYPLVELPDPYEPVAYWSFNEGTGVDVLDNSSHGNDGVIKNSDSDIWAFGKHCGGISFDGVDDYIEIPEFKGIAGGGSRTCCAWIKTDQSSFMLLNWGAQAASNKWNINLSNDGYLSVGIYGGYIVGENDLRDSLWHHIAVVFSNDGTPNVSEARMYIDGRLETNSVVRSYSVNTSASNNVKLGVDILGQSFSNGSIDEVMIFSRALDDSDIANIYNKYALQGDFDSDGLINIKDFSAMAYHWQDENCSDYDLNCDCTVNIDDFTILTEQWLNN